MTVFVHLPVPVIPVVLTVWSVSGGSTTVFSIVFITSFHSSFRTRFSTVFSQILAKRVRLGTRGWAERVWKPRAGMVWVVGGQRGQSFRKVKMPTIQDVYRVLVQGVGPIPPCL